MLLACKPLSPLRLGYSPVLNRPHWHVGDVVRKLREQKRWNQLKLAAMAGVNKATIVRVEEHAPGVKRETYEAVASALGATVGELFTMVPSQETQRADKTSSAAAGTDFHYDGPERRRENRGPPAGVPERRKATVGAG